MCKVTSSTLPLLKPRKAVTAAKTPRKVRFGHVQAKVFHQSLSRSEKKTIWYSGKDYKAMNKEVHRSLRKELCYGFDPNDIERTWRGLEHIREGVPNVKLERRRSFVRSFLYMHKKQGIRDPEKLGAMAAAHSSVDQVRAQQFADYDAYEASCVYYEQPCYTWCPIEASSSTETSEEDYIEFCNIPKSSCGAKNRQRTVLTARAI